MITQSDYSKEQNSAMNTETLAITAPELCRLAIAYWRLEKWLRQAESCIEGAQPARYAVREIGAVLESSSCRILDLTSQPYDPGLPVRVVATIPSVVAQDPGSTSCMYVIDEMISPVITLNNEVIAHGEVVLSDLNANMGAANDNVRND